MHVKHSSKFIFGWRGEDTETTSVIVINLFYLLLFVWSNTFFRSFLSWEFLQRVIYSHKYLDSYSLLLNNNI